jgi:hypothetical protein
LPSRSLLQEFLAGARRRELTHLILDKTVLAVAVGMGGLIVLLLAGTQVLDWYWVVLLLVASLGAGLYRLRRNIPTLYGLAQRIDRKLKLADALSTATYFAEHPAPERAAICERQLRDAETAARQVDLRQALPLRRSRYALPAAALMVVAMGLFGVRYLVTHSLSLEPSLLKIAYNSFFASKVYQAADRPRPPRANFQPSPGSQVPDASPLDANRPPDDQADNPVNPQSSNDTADASKTGDQGKPPEQNQDNPDAAKKDQKGDQSQNAKDASNSPPSGTPKDGKQGKGGKSQQNQQAKNSSLMDKLRDALADMMNKMKSSEEGQKQAKTSQQGKAGERQEPGQPSPQTQDQQQQSADSANQEGEPSDQQQTSDAKNAQHPSDKNVKDAKNGAGSQDGDKALRQAEQMQAMGKITEILGKRSANVSGEVMVEVGSGKQQLKTPWLTREATHSEAGSELHRDEVPLAYQQFVEQYFDEIRKAPPAKDATKGAAAPAAGRSSAKP